LDKRQATVPSTQATAQVLSKYEVGPPDAQELLELVNAERARVGVAPLALDEGLNTSARVKAEDMDKNHYFGHIDANGKHGYEYAYEYSANCKVPSENISWGQRENTTQSAMTGWSNSPPHYTAMVNPEYTLTGIGISSDKIVQHFCIVK
ncbi:hypothetical protein B7Z00_04630, partial [Candidatus Saccharibacteria bacterium 32-50-10]